MRSVCIAVDEGRTGYFIYLPSFLRGVGLGLIEGQAARLPCIFSDAAAMKQESPYLTLTEGPHR